MARMQETRTWVVGGAAAAAVLGAASWFFVISPVVSDADSLKSQTQQVQQQNDQTRQRTADLARQKSKLPVLKDDLGRALQALPMSNGMPAFTRQLNAQATDYGVSVTSLTVGTIAPVQVTAAGGAVTAPTPGTTDASGGYSGSSAGTGTSATGTSTTGTTTTGTSTTGTAPAGQAAVGGGTLMSMSVSVTATGEPARLLRWLHSVQVDGPRRALVNQLDLTNADKGGKCQLQVQITLFAMSSTTDQRKQMLKLLNEK